ncbi:Mechanosensitive ion channel-domain-containing protein [Polychytrium aggregatum]|uniref:Mechanosensitive ion channel-domain-containing protein n=1 Tax=Polychytrium aggregatum TaxID=110093 RepID=UPI0022FDB99E|nr:Mechanosensitive ion channel-domain-containing protein [Polychytrium aggregatum]KAI9193310.1 Mechanosensitive ion channel-domain-containing protein [Polychytrium aggregatum]
MWTAWFGLRWLLRIVPEIIIYVADVLLDASELNVYANKVEEIINYVTHLRPYLMWLMWSIIGSITWGTIFTEHIDPNNDWQKIIQLIWASILAASIVWCIEKFLLQVFAISFHKRAYRDRIRTNKDAFLVLAHLNKSRKVRRDVTIPASVEKSHESIDIHASPQTSKANLFKNVMTGLSHAIGAMVGLQLGMPAGIVLRNVHDAKVLAKTLFLSLRHDGASLLVPSDFEPYFDSPEEAQAAFRFFDKDGNGDISKSEMKEIIVHVFKERASIQKSLRDSSQAISTLDNIMKLFVWIITVFLWLGIWSIDTSQFLTVAISVWAGVLFAIGATIKRLVENIIFLFVSHPYDIGDRIELDGDAYFVKEFGLNTTVLRKVDGKETYVPNSTLIDKYIFNIRRSGHQLEEIKLAVVATTPKEKLLALQERILQFLGQESRDFREACEITISELVDRKSLWVTMVLEHKSNWQDGGKKAARRTRFMWALKEAVEDLGIEVTHGDTTVTIKLAEPSADQPAWMHV